MEGNQSKYSSDNVKSMGDSFLKGKNVDRISCYK